jgi:hypothetical protein
MCCSSSGLELDSCLLNYSNVVPCAVLVLLLPVVVKLNLPAATTTLLQIIIFYSLSWLHIVMPL